MTGITPEQMIINILEEAKYVLSLRPDLFMITIRRIIDRFFESSRITANSQFLLLAFSFDSFNTPFKEYYDRLFRKKLRESKLKENLLEKGLSEGGAIIATQAVDELDIIDIINTEGGIDIKTIEKKINDRLMVLGDDVARIAFQEIIHMTEVVLSDISRMGSEELTEIYEDIITLVKNNDIKAVRSKLDEYILKFDSRLRNEFAVR
jgi:hypothetical protein